MDTSHKVQSMWLYFSELSTSSSQFKWYDASIWYEDQKTSHSFAIVDKEEESYSQTQRTTNKEQRERVVGKTFIIDEETVTKTNEATTLRKRERARSSECGNMKAMCSYGKHGRASSYPGQRNKS